MTLNNLTFFLFDCVVESESKADLKYLQAYSKVCLLSAAFFSNSTKNVKLSITISDILN